MNTPLPKMFVYDCFFFKNMPYFLKILLQVELVHNKQGRLALSKKRVDLEGL